jgi:hypothetical protein
MSEMGGKRTFDGVTQQGDDAVLAFHFTFEWVLFALREFASPLPGGSTAASSAIVGDKNEKED